MAVTNNPTSFRFPFESQITKLSPDVQQVHRNTWNAIVDIQNAVKLIHSNSTATAATVKTVVQTIDTSNNSTEGVSSFNSETGDVNYYPYLGQINNQSGSTSYTTAYTDAGQVVVLSDTSPIAVTLQTVLTPWFCFISNQGSGTATLTPSLGIINYAGNFGALSMPLLGGYCCIVYFDGNNFWAWTEPIVPVNTPSVLHQFFTAYNALTGAFTATQPAFTDISGISAPAQLPIATTSTLGAVKPDGTSINVSVGGVIAVIGGPVPNFSDNETVSGSGTSWTLAHTPATGCVPIIVVQLPSFGGITLLLGNTPGFTITGAAVTTTSSYSAGAIRAWYRW